MNYKSGLRILIWPLEVPFFLVPKWALLAKVLQPMSLSGDKGVAQFKKSVKMEHPSAKVEILEIRSTSGHSATLLLFDPLLSHCQRE